MTDEENRDAWSQAVALLAHAYESRTSGYQPGLVEVPDPTAVAVVLADLSVALTSRQINDVDALGDWLLALDSSPSLADALRAQLHL